MTVFFFFFPFFLTCRALLCLFGGKYHMQVWLTAQTISVRTLEPGRGACLTLCFPSRTSSVRTQMCIHASRTQFSVKGELSFGPRLNNCALVFNVRVMLSARCDVHVWMKTDFDFGVDTVCVLVAAAQFRHTAVGKLSHLNPSEEKKEKHHFNSANERPRQICRAWLQLLTLWLDCCCKGGGV